MEVFFNECSLHGQFQNISDFDSALDVLMCMRRTVNKYNRELYCHRNCSESAVTNKLSLQQAVQRIDRSKARALMGWFSQAGPFWEDERRHSRDEYFESRGDVVTDTAIGECAFLEFTNRKAQLVSIAPSEWQDPLINVDWHKDDGVVQLGKLLNHCSTSTLDAQLKLATPPPESWRQLEQECRVRFVNISFSDDAFHSLHGRPFVSVAANSMLDLLDILSRFKAEHQPGIGRTQKGNELYQEFFTGDGAWFSDSTDREKRDFKNEMTFSHPSMVGETIFAPFHGKIQTPQMRIHFSWPVTADTTLYVLFVGDKITKY